MKYANFEVNGAKVNFTGEEGGFDGFDVTMPDGTQLEAQVKAEKASHTSWLVDVFVSRKGDTDSYKNSKKLIATELQTDAPEVGLPDDVDPRKKLIASVVTTTGVKAVIEAITMLIDNNVIKELKWLTQ